MEALPLTDAPLAPNGSDKILSMLSHLSALLGVGFLLPLVVYLAMRHESEYVAANAREALREVAQGFHHTAAVSMPSSRNAKAA